MSRSIRPFIKCSDRPDTLGKLAQKAAVEEEKIQSGCDIKRFLEDFDPTIGSFTGCSKEGDKKDKDKDTERCQLQTPLAKGPDLNDKSHMSENGPGLSLNVNALLF